MFYCEKFKLTCKQNTDNLETVSTLFFRFRIDILVKETWINVPMVVLVVFGLGPYGMALDFRYQLVNPLIKAVDFKAQTANNTNYTIKLSACPEVSKCALSFKCKLNKNQLTDVGEVRNRGHNQNSVNYMYVNDFNLLTLLWQ